ncbi:type I-E CRISPR-associated protein Cas5/CasD [Peterkaempfera bronchialis]|uniref:Type I-E CRISPR-associated protein Cas5/CasD n=1 Tax=Peterkaempfera bronchialis TaxID=2126346 RepID=A0A345T1F7_9ACTN|nr:type I-E CRISPR-associated protein Cas5/CasD [Peterkaempfera bronchialis]AXI79812.1 type I-E CRISPR-associated protein Cas5/CasD [Peterkaempfera bronchialis]
MTGFLLQLGAPLQSWGEHSAFTDRDTVAHPTRSGLIGMIASALGIPRAEAIADGDAGPEAAASLFARLTRLRFTVRTDRPGVRLGDFHTVGGGYPQHRTVPTAKGGRRSGDTATIVSRRHYLSDAVFTIAVTAPGQDTLLAECAQALAAPHWPLHLGRRSCPPGALLLLRADVPDPVSELDRVPLARPKPRTAAEAGSGQPDPTVTVRFTADMPFPSDTGTAPSGRAAVTMLNDEPVRLTARDRVHHARPVYSTSRRLPAALCGGYGTDYLDALDAYLHPPRPEGNAS